MKRTVFVLLSAAAFLVVAAKTAEKPLPPIAVQVEVKPSWKEPIQLLKRPTPYTYTCRADVIKAVNAPGTISVYRSLELIVSPGTRETETVKWDEYDVTFTVAVSKPLDRAAAEVRIARGDEVLHVHKSDVLLKAPDRTVVPR